MPEEILHLEVHFPDGMSGGVACVEVQPGRYQLKHSELILDRPLYLGDTVQLERRPDGAFDFVRRTARALLRRSCFLLTKEQSSAPELELYLARVTDVGGMWEVWFHGIVLLHMPRESKFDPRAEWARLFGIAPTEA
jgi:hypothetical protein